MRSGTGEGSSRSCAGALIVWPLRLRSITSSSRARWRSSHASGSHSVLSASISATAWSSCAFAGFFPPVSMPFVGRISSPQRIVVSASRPSRTWIATRYSFVRITKRPIATCSSRSIASTSSW